MLKIKNITLRIVAAILFLAVLYIFSFLDTERQNNFKTTKESGSETTLSQEKDKKVLYDIVSVADGDTLTVKNGDKKYTLRLLGVDAPELSHPSIKEECFSGESKEYLQSLLAYKKVSFLYDPLKPEKDAYGRHLVYVYREDGLFINQILIEEGFAYEYFYKKEPYTYHTLFKTKQQEAKNNKKGLWADNTCKGVKEIF